MTRSAILAEACHGPCDEIRVSRIDATRVDYLWFEEGVRVVGARDQPRYVPVPVGACPEGGGDRRMLALK